MRERDRGRKLAAMHCPVGVRNLQCRVLRFNDARISACELRPCSKSKRPGSGSRKALAASVLASVSDDPGALASSVADKS